MSFDYERARRTTPARLDVGRVSVSELVRSINIALGKASVDSLPLLDSNDDGVVGIDEILAAVDAALFGCP